MILTLHTTPGLEAITAEEIAARWPARWRVDEEVDTGDVRVNVGDDMEAAALLATCRTAHQLARPVQAEVAPVRDVARAEALAWFREAGMRAEVPELGGAASFAVRATRHERDGITHAFTSREIARVFGGALQDRYGTPVDLSAPEVVVEVVLDGASWRASVPLTDAPLSRRRVMETQGRVALRADVAAALVWLAGVRHDSEGALLDPFCGVGTIGLEALALAPRLRVWSTDRKASIVALAQANAARHAPSMVVAEHDADRLTRRFAPATLDWIVTDPPLGVRMGKHINFSWMYSKLLRQCAPLLRDGGRLVVVVVRREAFLHQLGSVPELALVRAVPHRPGGFTAHALVLERQQRG